MSALLTRQLKAGKDERTPLGAEQSFEEVDGKVDLDEFVQLATLMLTVERKVDTTQGRPGAATTDEQNGLRTLISEGPSSLGRAP